MKIIFIFMIAEKFEQFYIFDIIILDIYYFNYI